MNVAPVVIIVVVCLLVLTARQEETIRHGEKQPEEAVQLHVQTNKPKKLRRNGNSLAMSTAIIPKRIKQPRHQQESHTRNVPKSWPLIYNISETKLETKTFPWPRQLPWLGNCLMSHTTKLQSGKASVFVYGDPRDTKFNELISSSEAEIVQSCFLEDEKLLTCSCCDGKMLCPTTYERPSAYEPEMKGLMRRQFGGAFTDGVFRAVDWDDNPPGLSITVSGIEFNPKLVYRDECDFIENQPTLIIRNGWLQRITSPENFAHWIGELFGVVIHTLQMHSIERVVVLIPHCSVGDRKDSGWKYPCSPTKITYYDSPRPHYASTEMRGDWWFDFALEKGIPFLDAIIASPTHRFMNSKTICFEKLIISCPPPRMSPLSKYTHTISPLVRHWLAKNFAFGLEPPRLVQKRLVIINRKPGGTRFIANINELVQSSYIAGWEPSVLEFWNSGKSYLKMATLLQNTAVLVGTFGGDLTLQVFLRPNAVVIEVSLEHAASVDPFYLFQGIGSQMHFVRWFLRPSSIPELRGNPNMTSWEDDYNTPDYFNSWIRIVKNMTLPIPSFLSTLNIARRLLVSR